MGNLLISDYIYIAMCPNCGCYVPYEEKDIYLIGEEVSDKNTMPMLLKSMVKCYKCEKYIELKKK